MNGERAGRRTEPGGDEGRRRASGAGAEGGGWGPEPARCSGDTCRQSSTGPELARDGVTQDAGDTEVGQVTCQKPGGGVLRKSRGGQGAKESTRPPHWP